ncbi:uncharacterized protein LOC144037104 isoform X4 [Vanacampus margaritifer]
MEATRARLLQLAITRTAWFYVLRIGLLVFRTWPHCSILVLSMAPENGHQVSVYTSECSDGKSLPSPGSSIRLLLGTC